MLINKNKMVIYLFIFNKIPKNGTYFSNCLGVLRLLSMEINKKKCIGLFCRYTVGENIAQ